MENSGHHEELQRLCAVVERAKRDWEQTFDAVPDLITIIGEDHCIKRVNRATGALLGVHPRDLVGKKCYEVMHGSDTLPPGCPGALAMSLGTVQQAEFEEKWLQRTFSVTASPIRDDAGRVTSCVHVARDVTERKQKEDALTASERFLRAITDNIPGMVGYWDRELRCRFANQAYLQWFGRSSEEMIGMTIHELLGEELFKKNEPYMLRALAGEVQHFERTLTRTDGSVGHTWAHYIPDVVDGATRGFFVLVTDVTELKLAEAAKAELEARLQQAQKMESVGRLAGGVAHDFNNQLTVIMAYADMGLEALDASDPLYPMLQQIARAAERSAGLTHQLLAFARQQPVTPRVLDLNETVRDMMKMLRRLIGEHIHLTWRESEEPCRVKIDPTQADQIIANLCINARDAITDYGEIRIETGTETVGAGRGDRDILPGDYVYLAVRDNGCGMDQETLRQIFEPFFTTKELGKGTGLGLSTVYGITRQNGGFIEVESSAGRGTRFTIYLPKCREEAKASHAAAARHDAGGAETILLVEDEPSILGMARDLLEQKGYRVLAAHSPVEALTAAAQWGGEIHLLLTDVIMKQMNGRDLARELATRRPGIKCLYMSGYTADVIGHHGVMDDDVRFIGKPFKATELARRVREALDA
ncbi:PAS domain-containing sensor histidine kinase [Geomonas terrae]|uniref:histidine kinase n=1 Tax=Geomonas terrae TaxID=2562681 RepID=A0A4S1CDI8_9BACT|nr:PAS domain-containing sensor histidine kinase [Geomonas terrae]TGU71461.1 PAS domain-containing sensor histidine kinase [Geomonas terrae]